MNRDTRKKQPRKKQPRMAVYVPHAKNGVMRLWILGAEIGEPGVTTVSAAIGLNAPTTTTAGQTKLLRRITVLLRRHGMSDTTPTKRIPCE